MGRKRTKTKAKAGIRVPVTAQAVPSTPSAPPPSVDQKKTRIPLKTTLWVFVPLLAAFITIAGFVWDRREARAELEQDKSHFESTYRPWVNFKEGGMETVERLRCGEAGDSNVTARVTVAIRNDGTANAIDLRGPHAPVYILPIDEPVAKLQGIARALCDEGLTATSLYKEYLEPGRESSGFYNTRATFPNIEGRKVEAFATACIFYSDEHKNEHRSCEVRRFRSATDGQSVFTCEAGKPVTGAFRERLAWGICKT